MVMNFRSSSTHTLNLQVVRGPGKARSSQVLRKKSASESEMIAMSSGLFGEALQIQDMLTYLLGHRPEAR